MKYYSAIKKNEICHNIDEIREYYAKCNKSEKEKHYKISFLCEN